MKEIINCIILQKLKKMYFIKKDINENERFYFSQINQIEQKNKNNNWECSDFHKKVIIDTNYKVYMEKKNKLDIELISVEMKIDILNDFINEGKEYKDLLKSHERNIGEVKFLKLIIKQAKKD
tara:strand:+ start:6205 stop:6573 length:369 start_codon:yes stop_codon:yes gene_type:complete